MTRSPASAGTKLAGAPPETSFALSTAQTRTPYAVNAASPDRLADVTETVEVALSQFAGALPAA